MQELVVLQSSRQLDYPRHGRWDVDTEIWRDGCWIIAPLSQVRAGDAFQIIHTDAAGLSEKPEECFLSVSGARVLPHPDQSRDPDILIGAVEISTRTAVSAAYIPLPVTSHQRLPSPPTEDTATDTPFREIF